MRYFSTALIWTGASLLLLNSPLVKAQAEAVQSLALPSAIAALSTTKMPGEGFSEFEVKQLAQTLLHDDEPFVDFASSQPTATSPYAGVKLTNDVGETLYIAINTSDLDMQVDFPDGRHYDIPRASFAIELLNFTGSFSTNDFCGEYLLNGDAAFLLAPLIAVGEACNGEGQFYTLSGDSATIPGKGITLKGIIQLKGTAGDDTFDVEGTEGVSFSIDAVDGMDTIQFDSGFFASNADTTIITEGTLIVDAGEGTEITGGSTFNQCDTNSPVGSNVDIATTDTLVPSSEVNAVSLCTSDSQITVDATPVVISGGSSSTQTIDIHEDGTQLIVQPIHETDSVFVVPGSSTVVNGLEYDIPEAIETTEETIATLHPQTDEAQAIKLTPSTTRNNSTSGGGGNSGYLLFVYLLLAAVGNYQRRLKVCFRD